MKLDVFKEFGFLDLISIKAIARLTNPIVDYAIVQKWINNEEVMPAWVQAQFYQILLKLNRRHLDLLKMYRVSPEAKSFYVSYGLGVIPSIWFEKLQPTEHQFFERYLGIYVYFFKEHESLLEIIGQPERLLKAAMHKPTYEAWLKKRNLKHSEENLRRWVEEECAQHGPRVSRPEMGEIAEWERTTLQKGYNHYRKLASEYEKKNKSSFDKKKVARESDDTGDKNNKVNSLEKEEKKLFLQNLKTALYQHLQNRGKKIKTFLNQHLLLMMLDGVSMLISAKSSLIKNQRALSSFWQRKRQNKKAKFSHSSSTAQLKDLKHRLKELKQSGHGNRSLERVYASCTPGKGNKRPLRSRSNGTVYLEKRPQDLKIENNDLKSVWGHLKKTPIVNTHKTPSHKPSKQEKKTNNYFVPNELPVAKRIITDTTIKNLQARLQEVRSTKEKTAS